MNSHDTRFSWTPERLATLRRMNADGRSMREIAEALGGGLSRSAVIDKLHRLGLARGRRVSPPRRIAPEAGKATAKPRAAKAAPKRAANSAWTPALDAKLREIWPLGLSGRAMVRALGIERSGAAVLKRAAQLGLPPRKGAGTNMRGARRPGPARCARHGAAAHGRARPPDAREAAFEAASRANPHARHVPILSLKARGECRWPTRQEAGEHLFCGASCDPEQSYCEAHRPLSVRANQREGWDGQVTPEKTLAFLSRRQVA